MVLMNRGCKATKVSFSESGHKLAFALNDGSVLIYGWTDVTMPELMYQIKLGNHSQVVDMLWDTQNDDIVL